MEVKVFGMSIRVDVAIACMILGAIICSLLICQCVPAVKEGMASIDYTMGEGLNQQWRHAGGADAKRSAMGDLAGNVAPAPGAQLEAGQLFMFGDNKFSPSCCPSIYSGSTGCACMSEAQAKFLNERGDNRTEATLY